MTQSTTIASRHYQTFSINHEKLEPVLKKYASELEEKAADEDWAEWGF